MKKTKMILFGVLGAVSIAIVAAAIVMVRGVYGDALFYMDSKLGYFYAMYYRIAAAIALVLVIVWIIVLIVNLKKIHKNGGVVQLIQKARQPKTNAIQAQVPEQQVVEKAATQEASPQETVQVTEVSEVTEVTEVSEVAEEPPQEVAPNGFCGHCGAPCESTSAFCTICGKSCK